MNKYHRFLKWMLIAITWLTVTPQLHAADILEEHGVFQNYLEQDMVLDDRLRYGVGISGGRHSFSLSGSVQKLLRSFRRWGILYGTTGHYRTESNGIQKRRVDLEVSSIAEAQLFTWVRPDMGIGLGYTRWQEDHLLEQAEGGAAKTFYFFGINMSLAAHILLRVAYQKDHFIAGRGPLISSGTVSPGQTQRYHRTQESVTYAFTYRF